jgi:DNA-binding MarR family transcriptional regulator
MQLLTRERDRQDRRRYNLVLTAKGTKVSAQAKRLAEKAQRKFLQPLTDDEWEAAREVLCKLVFR